MDPQIKMTSKTVSILQYSAETKNFSSTIVVSNENEDEEVTPTEIVPSCSWMEDYTNWNVFGGCSHPTFHSLSELQEFNATGMELASRLEKELHGEAQVEPFLPILTNVSVGGKACGWWHLRDENYGFPINLQKIPISDSLKSDFSWWFTKVERWAWLEQRTVREQLNDEVSALQVRLKHELNSKGEGNPATTVAIVVASK